MSPPVDQALTARTRLRLASGCLLLIGLTFIQSPGLLVPDTKFDLVADPGAFLARAAHLWDPVGAMGQLQNQAYGYFWPMGPFFFLGDLVNLDGWVIQRLWMALVLCVAFVGAALLARATGVRSDAAALIAAFAYATSPRILTTIGPISIEAWPSAVAPWVLLALVIGSQRGSPRRAAALAGVGVAMVGGVNAAATFAVIPLGVLWLLTRSSGPRRRSMMFWWPVFTLLGTLWWLIPLFVMGSYSPPFLGFIESASVTTFPTTVFDALRGTSAWVPYVDPSWQGGYEVLTQNYLALNSGLVLMLGFVGMGMRRNPHRQFLALSVLLGLLMVTMGHQGPVESWFAQTINGSLDGVLAPIRNVHKFDPVVRLPMTLGLAWLLEIVSIDSVRQRLDPRLGGLRWSTRTPVLLLAVIAVLGAAMPALGGRLAPTPGVTDTPEYWAETSGWLDDQSGNEVALLAPGSGFAQYLWGTPRDEPMQYLGRSRWAIRNAIPLTPPGNIRMLDAIEARFNQGTGSAGLAPYLARSGIGYVVVRNDLAPSNDVPDPVLVRQTLADSPDIELVKTFGPEVGGEASLEVDDRRVLVNAGWQSERRAIEIYRVTKPVREAVTARNIPTVVGGPEDILGLLDHDLIGDGPTGLAADRDRSGDDRDYGSPLILTDGMLDRERFFGRVHDGTSAVRGPGDERRSGNPVLDYGLPGGARWRTTARLTGAKSISASTSLSDSNASGGSQQGAQPFAAVDDDLSSSWVSGGTDDEADWWRIDFEGPVSLGDVTISTGTSMPGGTELLIETDRRSAVVESSDSSPVVVSLGDEEASWLRISERIATGAPLELADVAWDGREIHRQLMTPRIPESWGAPQTILLRALRDGRTGCVTIEGRIPCSPDRIGSMEEPRSMERLVKTPAAEEYTAAITAVPRAGDALTALIQSKSVVTATGSSTAVPDARASGIAALDGDPGTTWTAALDDLRPTLSVNFARKKTIKGLTAGVASSAPVRRPTRLTLVWSDGRRDVELDDEGSANFPPIRTKQLQVRITDTDEAVSIDQDGIGTRLPVGITELTLEGIPVGAARPSKSEVSFRCGTGPTVTVNREVTRTRLIASPAELYAMGPVKVSRCGKGFMSRVGLAAGENLIQITGNDSVAPGSVILQKVGDLLLAFPGLAQISDESPNSATFQPSRDDDVLAWRQNVNPGWVAQQDDERLPAIVLDGWQQGWRLEGDAQVTAEFEPDSPYFVGLAVGGALLIALLGAVTVRRPRTGSTPAPIAPRQLSPVLMVGLGALAGGLLGGWWGLMAVIAGSSAVFVAWRLVGRSDGIAWAFGALPAVSSVAYFVRPWGSDSGWAGTWAWPNYLVIFALGALVAVAVTGDRRFKRIAGSSTNR